MMPKPIRRCQMACFVLLGLGLVLALQASIPAQNPKAEPNVGEMEKRLEEKLEGILKKHDLPALWAAKVYADGRTVMAATGVRKWKTDDHVKVDDVIHIGSCTKAMTAVMIAQLCSDGQLSLDSTLKEIFPDVEGLAGSSWEAVTVNELLQHRSGAPANADWDKLDRDHRNNVVAARSDMLQWLIKQGRPSNPKFLYSNVGFALLGHIVEKKKGARWESLIAKQIFEPLQMTSAGFGPVKTTWGHVEKNGIGNKISELMGKKSGSNFEPVQTDNAPPLGPAGRVQLTMADWSKFVTLFASEKGYEKLGIQPDIWSAMLKANPGGDYAGGWVLLKRDWAGGPVLFHNGSNTTWYCVVFVAPGKNFCLMAATNAYSPAAKIACDQAVTAALELGF